MMLLFVFVLFMLITPLWGSGDDLSATADASATALSDSTSTASITGGDQIISGGDAIGLAQSLGDVDIEGCVVTEQWGIIVYQRQNWDYDPWCLAAILDQQGKHLDAAKMRCSDKDTEKIYGDECMRVMTFSPAIAPSAVATPNQAVDRDDEEGDEIDEHHQQIKVLTDRLDKYESDRQNSVNAYRRQQQIQQQQYEEVYEFQEQRQRKIDQIKKEFGDAGE